MMGYAALLISWIAVALSQRPDHPVAALFVSVCAYALFWWGIGKKRPFLKGFLWFFTATLFHTSWLIAPTYQGGYIFFLHLALSSLFGLQFALVTQWTIQRKIPLLAIASLWVFFEWSRLFIFSGFPFHPFGIALLQTPISGQLARWGGVYLLSFLVIVTNLLAYYRKKWAWAVGALLPYLPLLFSHKSQEKNLEVALFQPSHLPDALREDLLSEWIEKIEGGIGVDLAVLPETAFPYGYDNPLYPLHYGEAELIERFGAVGELPPHNTPYVVLFRGELWVTNAFFAQFAANFTGAEWIVGLDKSEEGKFYNNAYHFFPGNRQPGVYSKQRLVPFAEYMPLSLFRSIAARYGIEGEFTSGASFTVTGDKTPLSLSVCYEECFGHFMRGAQKRGASLLVNVTNDGWFAHGALPKVHLLHARARAIENGLPLIHANNTGESVLIDAQGNYLNPPLPSYQKGVLKGTLPLDSLSSPYSLWGDYPIIALCFSLLLIPFFSRINALSKKRGSVNVSL